MISRKALASEMAEQCKARINRLKHCQSLLTILQDNSYVLDMPGITCTAQTDTNIQHIQTRVTTITV